ncbi:hypothetical protein [Kordia jejudonensis]|uniref:hypothetical protein n=1 Tax=Kordia jejudonensis TaxID=1348245 RepID=UPI0006299E0A|nr:hypothetical protein [Kordia jejudonensis]
MRTILMIAIGFWIANRLSKKYHKRLFMYIQHEQKQKFEALLKSQGFEKAEIKKQSQSIFKL